MFRLSSLPLSFSLIDRSQPRLRYLLKLMVGLLCFGTIACQPLTLELQEREPADNTVLPTQTLPASPTAAAQTEEEQLMDPSWTEIPQVIQAIADLAKRLQIAENSISVVRVEEVDWPDSSAGCPQPGMMYKQVLSNGMFIQLEVDDQRYNYHSTGMRDPFLCTSKNEVVPEEIPAELRGDPDV